MKFEMFNKFQRKLEIVKLCTSNLPTNAQYNVESTIETEEKTSRSNSS